MSDMSKKEMYEEYRKYKALNKLFQFAPKLDYENVLYILGIAQGMAMLMDNEKDKSSKEVQCV